MFLKVKISLVIVINIIYVHTACINRTEWNYDNLGVDYWPSCWTTCKGKSQSPIDIRRKETVYNPQLEKFDLINYNWDIKFNVNNTGKTVVFEQADKGIYPLKLSGSNLNDTYDFEQFHFHWGANNFQGSEHRLDGKKYPLELHLIYKKKSSFTVLGFLFKLTGKSNTKLDKLLEALNRVPKKDDETTTTLKLSKILPEDLKAYYQYNGSFTVPPCTEGILWNVFETPIEISSNQMESFRKNVIKKNFRELEELNSRKVESSLHLN